MNKWSVLLLITLCLVGAGLLISKLAGIPDAQHLIGEPTKAERIVAMAPNLTEILFALGLEDRIVGVTLHSDYPPAAEKKPKMGTFWQPDIEAIIGARPNLVITLAFEQQRNLASRLKRLGCETLTVNIEKVSELFDAVETIGAVTGTQAKATTLIDGIKKKFDNLSALIRDKAKIKVLWVIQREPLRVAGQDTFINEMIELAGGQNAIGPTLHKYPPIGSEQLIACAPQIIIEPVMGKKDLTKALPAAIKYYSRFENMPAVKNNRIYVIDGDTVSRLSPRLYEGVETIAKCLRPELFEN